MTPNESGAGLRRRPPWGFASAVLAYAAVRLLVVHTAFDEVSPWMYELSPMGTLAQLLLHGVPIPPHFFYDNAGGQLLAGYLTVPAFVILGPSYLALKVAPFGLGLATLLLVHGFLRGVVGRKAAILGAWFVALAPTTFLKYSVVCSGNHPENVFFSMLVLVLFFRIEREEITARGLFALGAASGLALFNSLGVLVLLVILCAMHVGLRGLRASVRDLPAAFSGFVLGVLPLLVVNAMTRGRGVSFLEAKFGEPTAGLAHGPGDVLSRAARFLFARSHEAPCYPDFGGLRGASLGWIFTLGAGAACVACLPSAARGIRRLWAGVRRSSDLGDRRERLESAALAPIVLHVPLSALAFGLSNLVVHETGGEGLAFMAYRYYLPCILCVLIAATVACTAAWRRGGAFRVGAVLLAASILVPGVSNLALIDWSFSHTGIGRAYEGYDLTRIGRSLVSPRVGLSHPEILGYLDRLSPEIRARVLRGIGFNLGVVQLSRSRREGGSPAMATAVDFEAIAAGYPLEDRPELARGAGASLRFQGVTSGASPAALLERIAANEPAFGDRSPEFLEGVCLPTLNLPLAQGTSAGLGFDASLLARSIEMRLPPRIVDGLARGEGSLCGMLLRRGIASDDAVVRTTSQGLPADLHEAFFRGFWAGWADQARQGASAITADLSSEDRERLERSLSNP